MWSQWLVRLWHGGLCPIGWFEYLRNCWSLLWCSHITVRGEKKHKNISLRLQWAQAQQDWKNITWASTVSLVFLTGECISHQNWHVGKDSMMSCRKRGCALFVHQPSVLPHSQKLKWPFRLSLSVYVKNCTWNCVESYITANQKFSNTLY